MGRPRLYDNDERKERKKEYDIRYQNERYKIDSIYRDLKKDIANNTYLKSKEIRKSIRESINKKN